MHFKCIICFICILFFNFSVTFVLAWFYENKLSIISQILYLIGLLYLCPCWSVHPSVPTYIRASQSWYPFSNFSLPQPNVMKLIHNAYYHKTQIKFEFWWHLFYFSRVMLLYKWKNCWIFRFCSLASVCLNQMLWNL